MASGIAFLAASSSQKFSNDAFWDLMILISAGLSIGHPILTRWMMIIGIRTVSSSNSVLSIRVQSSRNGVGGSEPALTAVSMFCRAAGFLDSAETGGP